MDTLFEFFDANDPMMNAVGVWMLKPNRAVFFHYGLEDEERERRKLIKVFREMGVRTAVQMVRLDSVNADSLVEWMEQYNPTPSDCALELSGGDDVMLFMAGRCFEKLNCRVYARRSGGRYVSLTDGSTLKGTPPVFSVEERMRLYGGAVERYGRVKPGDLTLGFRAMSMTILELQKKHPQLWTKQTLCLQQAVAKMEDEGLTLRLKDEYCRSFGFSAQKGHLFRELLNIGALTSYHANGEYAEITFKNRLTMECLCDHGIWLEVYIYHMMRICGEFDDVRISCVVNWENERAVNELDVVATAGMGMAVVSCKTCVPDMEALSELNVLRERFGEESTVAILAAMPKGTARMDGMNARFNEIDIRLMDVRQYNADELKAYFARLGRRMKSMR